VLLFKALRKSKDTILWDICTPIAKIMFILNGVSFGKGLRVNGLMKVFVTRRGTVSIGQSLRVNSGKNSNIIGRQQICTLWVDGVLTIGDNVGMSAASIICNHQINIGNNVMIGGNTVIYDTDFHAVDPMLRNSRATDRINAKWGAVTIGNNVFVGAHSTILKGVSIGDNSVVGACAVVTKDIPENEVWAGNPAVCIHKITLHKSAH